ncbi:secretory calcium-binding phosphoprotein 7 isoform X2 [Alosa alosa]|uniref:secretory calcium-binding phosphoprotein 7 isoform X2 n=1 Tax=Alosa alosa TaxID=278164 RepID=UPI00201548CD|nr:secretory calcium-binding phosphoprotein 7 isoform X2 [Alosa alosa]
MKAIIVLSCMVGMALCAPQLAPYIQVEIKQAPGAAGAAPAVSGSSLQSILDALRAAQAAGGPQVLVKQEIPQPAGRESVEIKAPSSDDDDEEDE